MFVLLVAGVLIFGGASSGQAAVINVPGDMNFQTALNTAASDGTDDTINLGAGNYTAAPYTNTPTTNNSLIIQGAGSGSTILDGGGTTRILTVNTTGLGDDSNAHITIKGLTFRNGLSAGNGGGLDVVTKSANITVEDSVFSNNSASGAGGGANFMTWFIDLRSVGGGAGLRNAVLAIGDVTLTNNTFTGNSAQLGGGAGINIGGPPPVGRTAEGRKRVQPAGGEVNLTGNTFNGNSAVFGGFDLDGHALVSPRVVQIILSSGGGGAWIYSTGPVSLTGNTFSNNSTEFSVINGVGRLGARIINGFGSFFGGGGAWIYSDELVTLHNNAFSGNSADLSAQVNDLRLDARVNGNGFGAAVGGGAGIFAPGPVTFTNNIFNGNSVVNGDGGGAGVFSDDVTLTNNTFSGNNADPNGGGLFVSLPGGVESVANIYNNIIWGNTAVALGFDLYVLANPPGSLGISTVHLYNNDYSESGFYIDDDTNLSEADNIHQNPLLTPDFHLQAGSPCIDTGTNGAPGIPPTDFEGDDRVIDGDDDGTDIADMGADEFLPGSITIVKDAMPDDFQIFDFTGVLGAFSLDDDGVGDNSITFTGLAAGSYNVAEIVPAGWDLAAITCNDPDSQTVVNLANANATIDLDPGESITCTFTNVEHGSITIVKDAVPDHSQLFEFTGDLGNFPLDDDGVGDNSITFTGLAAGSYNVAEIVPAGWDLADITCNAPDGQTMVNLADASATIDLDPGEGIMCTFKNKLLIVNRYTLSVDVEPAGGGSVSGNGIGCPGDCSESYDEGTMVRLVASPAPGYAFDHWSGCSSTRSLCDVTMNSNVSATAHFREIHRLNVKVLPPDSGRVSGDGIECPNDCGQDYSTPTTVTLTAQPNEGFIFAGWRGCGTDDACDVQCDVFVEEEVTVWAIFLPVSGRCRIYREPLNIFSTTWMLFIPVLQAHLEGGEVEIYWILSEYVMPGGYFTVVDYGLITCPIQTEVQAILQFQNGTWRLIIPVCDVEFDPDRPYWLEMEVDFTNPNDIRLHVIDFGLVE